MFYSIVPQEATIGASNVINIILRESAGLNEIIVAGNRARPALKITRLINKHYLILISQNNL